MDKYNKIYDEARARIFDLMRERKINQKELAIKLGVSQQTITDWKKGKSNSFMRSLEPVARALQTTPSWIFSGIGEKDFSDEQWEKRTHLTFEQAYEVAKSKIKSSSDGEEKKHTLVSEGEPPGLFELGRVYRSLNDEGREKLLDYAADLEASGRYIKSGPAQLGQAKDA